MISHAAKNSKNVVALSSSARPAYIAMADG